MMFRSMTIGQHKRCGFVDLNIHRAVNITINYVSQHKPGLHVREAAKYILQEKLINLNGDHWLSSFGNDNSCITRLCYNIYSMYSMNIRGSVNSLVNQAILGQLISEYIGSLGEIFKHLCCENHNVLIKLTKDTDRELLLNKGLERGKVKHSEQKRGDEDDMMQIDEHVDSNKDIIRTKKTIAVFLKVLENLIVLLCIFSIRSNVTSFFE